MSWQTTCAKMMWSGYHEVPCKKPGKVERDGRWWCGIHDPEVVKARDAKRNERWRQESEARAVVYRLHRAAPALVDALAELVRLKDGPRDAEYERRKPLAWEAARAALAATGRTTGHTVDLAGNNKPPEPE